MTDRAAVLLNKIHFGSSGHNRKDFNREVFASGVQGHCRVSKGHTFVIEIVSRCFENSPAGDRHCGEDWIGTIESFVEGSLLR